MGIDDGTLHNAWLAVARAATDHRRITPAGDEVFYGDLTLLATADTHAWAELLCALRSALDVEIDREEIVDALRSGDSWLDPAEANELIEWARTRDERLRELNAWLLGGFLGEHRRAGAQPHEGWATRSCLTDAGSGRPSAAGC
jgi:hypothetical protein